MRPNYYCSCRLQIRMILNWCSLHVQTKHSLCKKWVPIATPICGILIARVFTILQFRLNSRLALVFKYQEDYIVLALQLVTSASLILEYPKYSHNILVIKVH
jgi:hypothetical protein